MDTIYYTVKATRQKVSGGEDLVRREATPAAPTRESRGQVLDFVRYRQSFERRQAWQALKEAAYPTRDEDWDPIPYEPVYDHRPASPRGEKLLLCLEVLTSLSVLAVSLVACLRFG